MPDYTTGERDKQRAIERWENEGGKSTRADFVGAHEREPNDKRSAREGTAERTREIEA